MMAHLVVSAQKETLHEDSIGYILSSFLVREVLPYRTEMGSGCLKHMGMLSSIGSPGTHAVNEKK